MHLISSSSLLLLKTDESERTKLIRVLAKHKFVDAQLYLKISVLHCQVVSQYSGILSPIAVDAVMNVVNPALANNVDLNDIKIVKKLG